MNYAEQDDGTLLGLFADAGSEEAFAELVQRHGGMVQATARRVLGDAHEAKDVAQATFLALARKARSLRRDSSLAGWLYRVSWRLALDVHKARVRRVNREERAMMETGEPTTDSGGAELRRELDAALNTLPDRYRHPLLLVHLEHHSTEAAAARLRLNPNTLRTRLKRGREMLRRRLVRRGVTIGTVGALTALLSSESGAAVLPASFVSTTVEAAGLAAAGNLVTGVATGVVSTKVAAMTKGAINMIFWSSVKTATAVTAAVVVVAGSGVMIAQDIAQVDTQTVVTSDQQAEPALWMSQGNSALEKTDIGVVSARFVLEGRKDGMSSVAPGALIVPFRITAVQRVPKGARNAPKIGDRISLAIENYADVDTDFSKVRRVELSRRWIDSTQPSLRHWQYVLMNPEPITPEQLAARERERLKWVVRSTLVPWFKATVADSIGGYRNRLHPDAAKGPQYGSDEAFSFWRKQVLEMQEEGFDGTTWKLAKPDDVTDRFPEGSLKAHPIVKGTVSREFLTLLKVDGGWRIARLFESLPESPER